MPEPNSAWPLQMDALIAAADHHRLVLENEQVRVLETRIKPGETTPLHTHEWPAAQYVLNWSDFVRRDEHGETMLDTRSSNVIVEPGQAVWSGPLAPHTLENVGTQALHIISVEVKPTTSGLVK
jgi:mannose-6-phosphate isomerase-like protein (cupin superfamily)